MTTSTPDATIYFSINDGEWQKYSSAFIHNDACNIKTYCTANGLMKSPMMQYDFELYINKSAWKLVSVDSQHSGNEATKAFDNNTSTFWHTEYQGSEPKCPHSIVIDMIRTYEVTAFTYTARTDGSENGMVKNYQVYLSMDGKTWGTPVVAGEFKKTTAMQIATLSTPKVGRYLKFVATSEVNNNAWTSASEIGIQASSDVTAINEVDSDNKSDSKLFYSLKGIATTTPTHGVYIHQGKKILY